MSTNTHNQFIHTGPKLIQHKYTLPQHNKHTVESDQRKNEIINTT